MDRYSLPSVVHRGLHRLATGSLGFGNLLPTDSCTYYSFMDEHHFKKIIEQLANECGPSISSDLEKKLNAFHPGWICKHESMHKSEEYLWGYKATNNVFLRGIFSALAFGELEFCERDLPQKSHEERLTGHLLSKMYSSVNFCADSLTEFSKELYGKEIPIEVAYHDLSTGNREKVTGSDFGIIIHTRLPGEDENIQAAAFQAKKLYDNKAYLPIIQASAQRNFFGIRGAYTCLYDVGNTKTSLPPAVIKTSEVVDFSTDTPNNHVIGRNNLPPSTIALSLFLIKLISRQTEALSCQTLTQAAELMKNPGSKEQLGISRVMTISIGARGPSQIDDLKKLFPPLPSDEEEPTSEVDSDHRNR